MKKAQDSSGIQRKVADVMSRDPATIGPDATLQEAASVMWTLSRSCLPVVSANGQVVGILTDRDVAMCSFTQGRLLRELPVSTAMRHDVVAAYGTDDVEIADALMVSHDVHRLPVLDIAGRIIGIVARSDLDRHSSNRFDAFAAALGGDQVLTPPFGVRAVPADGAGNGSGRPRTRP